MGNYIKFIAVAALFLKLGFSQYTDPNDPSMPDSWFIQGEYFGYFEDDSTRLGAHVRATTSQYRIHFTIGGLPGDTSWPMGGWDYQWRNLVSGLLNFSGGSMQISGTGVNATLTIPGNVKTAPDSLKTIEGTLQNRPFKLHRVRRKSPTEGLPPVEGARVLFDGTQQSFNDNWSDAGGGRFDGQTQTLYRGVNSRGQFQQMFLHIEIYSSYMPDRENQARSNSGVYLQNRYEQQIMDSFGEEGLENDSKGALYGGVPPQRNATLPPLVNWETYDIMFTPAQFNGSGQKTANATFKTWLNGIKVQDGEMTQPGTGGAPEGPSPGPIHLQNHGGDPIFFRNIWIVENSVNFPDTTLFTKCWDGSSLWTSDSLKCPDRPAPPDTTTPAISYQGLQKSLPSGKKVLMLGKNGIGLRSENEIYNILGKSIPRKRIEP